MTPPNKRPRTWDLKSIHYKPGTPEYSRAVTEREHNLLMPWVNEVAVGGEIYFATYRDTIGKMALPYLLQLLQYSTTTRHVLEIGGGEGQAILYLLSKLEGYINLPKVIFTMTSLSHQPEQAQVEKKGVRLQIPQIAEALPPEWSDSFDMVLTSSLFGWVSIHETLAEIKRVLKKGGYWMAMEAKYGVPLFSNSEYREIMPVKMREHQMVNSISAQEWLYWMKEDIFPIVYKND